MRFTTANINWFQFSVIIGTVIVLWTGLGQVIPEPYYGKVTIILAAIQTALVHLLKASKPPVEPPK